MCVYVCVGGGVSPCQFFLTHTFLWPVGVLMGKAVGISQISRQGGCEPTLTDATATII